MDLSTIRAPYGDRCSPVPVAGYRPITGPFEPVSKPPLFQVSGNPMDLLICIDEFFFDLFNRHKPTVHCTIDKRRVGAPTEGISMVDRPSLNESAHLFESMNDILIGIFDKFPGIFGDFLCELAILIHGAYEFNPRLFASIKVVLSKSRGHMDDSGPFFKGDKIISNHSKSSLAFLICKIGKGGLISFPHKGFPFLGSND